MESENKNIPDIEKRFTYHKPTDAQQCVYPVIRTYAKELAYKITELVPEGREKSLALTKLEEVVMWANAGISRVEIKTETLKKEDKPKTITIETEGSGEGEAIIGQKIAEGYRIINSAFDPVSNKRYFKLELKDDDGGGMSAR